MVEYRVLSSAMMKDVDTLEFVWNQLSTAIFNCSVGNPLVDSDIICDIINNSDIESAKRIISEYNIM